MYVYENKWKSLYHCKNNDLTSGWIFLNFIEMKIILIIFIIPIMELKNLKKLSLNRENFQLT